MKTGLQTERLILREMTEDDFDALYEIFSDADTMRHYPKPFDAEKVHSWIAWNRENYATFGFGLWTVVRKDDARVIGDCGVTMQLIHGKIKPEIGYHIHKSFQRMGYATEAVVACRDFLFEHTCFDTLYSYMKYTNAGSWRTAERNGMRLLEEYEDPVNTVTRVYAITRDEWNKRPPKGDTP